MSDLDKILTEHTAWLRGEPGGRRADLRGADLSGAYLCGAELGGADLRGANLREASLCWADLRKACLRGAELGGADLSKASLHGADLREANLRRADLRWAEVRGGPRFVAGCRNFSAAEALSHWGPESPRSQPEYVAVIRQWLADNAENAG